MADFPRRFLLNTPPDILACVVDNLSASDLLTLYLCGETALIARLTAPGCLTRFNFSIDARNVRFPTFAYSFPSLAHFSLYIGFNCKCFGISRFTYSRLPQTLKSLSLTMDSPGYALVSGYHNILAREGEEGRKRHLNMILIDFPQAFPLLESLVLRGNWNELSAPDVVFPPLLTNLELEFAPILAQNFVQSLPASLTSLSIGRNNLTEADIAALPESLDRLQIGYNNILSSSFLKLLPRRLRHLVFDLIDVSPSGFEQLPPTLQSVRWRGDILSPPSDLDHPVRLPETIESLEIHEFNADDWVLPPNLRTLEVSGRRMRIVKPLPRTLKSFSLGNTLDDIMIQQLPVNLTELRTSMMAVGAATLERFLPTSLTTLEILSFVVPFNVEHMHTVHAKCPNLTVLKLPFSEQLSTEESMERLPSRLQTLEVQNSFLNINNVDLLPPSLTLMIVNIQSNLNGAVAMSLPRTLTWLQVFQTSLGDSDIAFLPRNLKCLVFSSTSTLSDASVPGLPPRLTRLDILSRTNFNDQVIAQLPRSLVEIRCPVSNAVTPRCIPDLPIGMSCVLFAASNITVMYFERQADTLSKRRSPRLKHLV